MPTNLDLVKEFHAAFGHRIGHVNETHTMDGAAWDELVALRTALIEEELAELKDAMFRRDPIDIADAVADLLYVVYGTGIVFGTPVNEVFAEVHRSNMSKLGEDGKPIYREDGKVLKGPNFRQPAIKTVIDIHSLQQKLAGSV